MKKIIINKYNLFIAFILSILGFSTSCEKDPVVEYGVPTTRFKVKGTITNQAKTPVEGIRVVMYPDSTLTDASGNYEVEVLEFPSDRNFTLNYKDIDGATNGEFAKKDSIVEFNNNQYQNGDGNWYEGEVEKTVDIKLEDQ